MRTTFLKKLDRTRQPWQIDLQLDALTALADQFARIQAQKKAAANAGKGPASIATQVSQPGVMQGIVRLEGDKLVYCVAAPGKPRPSQFAVTAGSRHELVTLERFSTGEQAAEAALKAAGAYVSKDVVGWIVNVNFPRRAEAADEALLQLADLKKLQTLYLQASEVPRGILKIIGSRTTLHSLSIRVATLRDDDLAALSGLTDMRSLALHSPHITDAGMKHLAKMTKLYNLRLGDSQLTDAGLERLTHLKLDGIQLDRTQITDQGLSKLVEQIPTLTFIQLAETRITDAGLRTLAKLSKLQTVNLAGTAITDAGLSALAEHTTLQRVNLSGVRISDAGLAQLGRSAKMMELNLNGTQVTDRGLQQIATAFPELRHLRLRNADRVTDRGLQHLTSLKKLTWLDITRGQFAPATLRRLRQSRKNLSIRQRDAAE